MLLYLDIWIQDCNSGWIQDMNTGKLNSLEEIEENWGRFWGKLKFEYRKIEYRNLNTGCNSFWNNKYEKVYGIKWHKEFL